VSRIEAAIGTDHPLRGARWCERRWQIMKLGRFGLLATVLLLVGTVAVSATGCVLVPYPVGGYGHYNGHDEQDGRPYRR
jgi:hypothetical protein